MEPYISKATIVAEIERLSDIISQGMFTDESRLGIEYFKERVLSFLDTIEAKEVKEAYLDEYVDSILEEYDCSYDKIDLYDFAKHFFELGLKTQK